MAAISFCKVAFLIGVFLFHIRLVVEGDPVVSKTREALEIIIGGGGGSSDPAPPPDYQDCPPPPPPPTPCPPPPYPFESKRLEIVYPVIQKFKNKIKNDPLGITKTWTGTDICNYKGFHCAIVPDFRVKALHTVNFNGFGFCGPELTIDGFIDELPDVSIFHANSNGLTGTIPKKIANLRYLFELDLSNNKYNCEFPYEVLRATNLTFLDLRFNTFSGLVPPQVFTLDLDVLFINNNNFVQKLPDNLGSLPVLYLTLANNRFTGSIPPSIGKACNTLAEVLFLNNQLSGCLPSEIGLLKKATVFDVSKNFLTGPIPQSFACLGKIDILNLAKNQFYGAVPEQVCKLSSLSNFSLSDNYFTEVGPECCKKIDEKILDVSKNCIPGLPNQRPKAECDAFFSKPRRCPNEKSFSWIPCKSGGAYPNPQSHPNGGGAARSYNVLKPHRL